MKKTLLLTAATTLFFGFANAQNAIPNPGFESWTSQGSYDDCAGWGTIDQPVSSACFCKGTSVKTAVAGEFHSGALAIKLKTLSVFGQTAPGISATGTINQTTQAIDGGVVYNLRPDSIVGWYRYAPTGTDTGSVDITLSKWSGTARTVVGHARFIKTISVSSYARFAVPLTYSLTIAPDTMVIILLSSSTTAAQVGSTMFVDDLDLVFNASGIVNNNTTNSLVSIYPNPNNGVFNLSISQFDNNKTNSVEVYNTIGECVYRQSITSTNCQINVSDLAVGVYQFTIYNSEFIITKRLVIVR
ncbi:MAG TPA: T9SS type A sorting domain-containing protein [Bacteroidia bacterium]